MKYPHLPHRRSHTARQAGVVLAMVLIFLSVLSVVALYTVRDAVTGEQVSKNIHTNAVAMQSAETAMRLCEDAVRTGQAMLGSASVVKNDASEGLAGGDMPTQWKTRANWYAGAAKVTLIPADYITTASMRPLPRPRCMIEQYRLRRPDGDATLSDPYLITAVGYSPDYLANANGNAVAGSEVWLQSVLRP